MTLSDVLREIGDKAIKQEQVIDEIIKILKRPYDDVQALGPQNAKRLFAMRLFLKERGYEVE